MALFKCMLFEYLMYIRTLNTSCSKLDSRINFFFVTGRDLSGRKIDLKQYFERGASVSEMKTAWLAVNGQ